MTDAETYLNLADLVAGEKMTAARLIRCPSHHAAFGVSERLRVRFDSRTRSIRIASFSAAVRSAFARTSAPRIVGMATP